MSFRLVLEDLSLAEAEKNLCIEALNAGGTIVDAAKLLGITRHALKRRIIKHRIDWPRKARVE
ncbi:MAG: helix-turn-helix domain-containing protein [Nannocystaceae bacterium]